MAITLIEGFDTYNGLTVTSTAVGLGVRWSYSSNTAISTTTPYNIGQSLSTVMGTGAKRASIGVATNSTGAIGFAFYTTNLPSSNADIVGFMSGGAIASNRQFSLMLLSNGALGIGTGTVTTTTIYSSTNLLLPATWNYIELEFTIADSAAINIYVNGALFGSATGLDTKSQTVATTYDTLLLGSTESVGYGPTVYYDDLYLTDTPSRLGEQRVVTVVPTSDGTPSQWAASGGAVAPYTMVDEALCNGDTDYIYDGTLGDRAVFNMASTGATPVSVGAVQIGTYSRKTDTGARSIQLQYVDGGGTAYSSSNFALGSSYARQLSLLQTNPATSTAWTPSEANALKTGVRISV